MKRLLLLFAVTCSFWTAQSVVAANFVGQINNPRYQVTECLDGGCTTAEQAGPPLQLILTTDYTQIDWGITFDVDNLLMTGSPAQPFETRFSAHGIINTDAPSPLAFPDAQGNASSGQYSLVGGPGEWTFTKRIVTATTTYPSGPKTIPSSGITKFNSLNVANYPTNVTLRTNMDTESFFLGRINLGTNHFLEAYLSFPSSGPTIQWPQSLPLTEVLPGDFSGNGSVDGADYPIWRKSPGLAAFLTSYDEWRGNFGNSPALGSGDGSAVNVPEPSALLLVVAGLLLRRLVGCRRTVR